MKAIGKIINTITNSVDWRTVITMEISASPRELEKYMQKEKLSIEIKQFREKRSLDANSYYWVLITKLAEAIGISNNRQHNLILQRYGQFEFIGDKMVVVHIPDTLKAHEQLLEEAKYHLRPTAQILEGDDEEPSYRVYYLLKGSSSYNTKEMARLIDGIVSECKEVGIETLLPHELERMKREWGVE